MKLVAGFDAVGREKVAFTFIMKKSVTVMGALGLGKQHRLLMLFPTDDFEYCRSKVLPTLWLPGVMSKSEISQEHNLL